MRTYVYIDAFNLYYGCLHRTQYKWLDVYKLFANSILKMQSPSASVEKIKFFTADIRANLATHGQEASIAQGAYHRALEQSYPNQIEIIKGDYSLEKRQLPRYYEGQKHPDITDKVAVWNTEEKQTDVNIAIHLYRDALIEKCCDQVVIVSNDTDLAPAIKFLKKDGKGKIQIGIVIPVREPDPDKPHRPPNKQLSEHADWTRRYIQEEELEKSQLPDMIPTRKKPIRKPGFW